MSRYRKVEVKLWTDERFRALSAAPPNAQTLWLYLLCGPRTTTFPGLVVAREAVMADDLGWSAEAFREAFGEALAKALVKADWRAGVVMLSRGLIDSSGTPRDSAKPESPNVIKSWAKSWDDVPDSPLKTEYLLQLGAFAEALGEGFHKAYLEAFAKALAKPSPNQEQEQEQDIGVAAEPLQLKPAATSQKSRKSPRPSRKKPNVPMPDGWQPTERERAKATSLGLNCDQQAERFRDHHTAKGSTFADWDAAFRTWIGNSLRFQSGGDRPAPAAPVRLPPRADDDFSRIPGMEPS